jgi:hypothetical protein
MQQYRCKAINGVAGILCKDPITGTKEYVILRSGPKIDNLDGIQQIFYPDRRIRPVQNNNPYRNGHDDSQHKGYATQVEQKAQPYPWLVHDTEREKGGDDYVGKKHTEDPYYGITFKNGDGVFSEVPADTIQGQGQVYDKKAQNGTRNAHDGRQNSPGSIQRNGKKHFPSEGKNTNNHKSEGIDQPQSKYKPVPKPSLRS